jgi:hypothetical protein
MLTRRPREAGGAGSDGPAAPNVWWRVRAGVAHVAPQLTALLIRVRVQEEH